MDADNAFEFLPLDDYERLAVSSEQLERERIYGFRNGDVRGRPFRLLRTQLRKRLEMGGLRLIGVTSAAPGVGKSFCATNLAAALSRIAEQPVYLVDLDMHRPAIAKRLGHLEGDGIHDLLGGDAPSLRHIARRINEENLVFIPGFVRPVSTAELLASPAADRFFAGLRALPDGSTVIVDMPPIFADDDAALIASRLDGFILVVEDARTTYKQVQDTIRLLQPTPLVGTILNRYRNQLLNDDYGYGVGYGYGAYYRPN